MFKNRLKIKVLIKLMRHGAAIKILDNLIKTVIEIDNKFY